MNSMKTVLLGATAMVALSTGAFAANTSIIEQEGAGITADVQQTGDNKSSLTQKGETLDTEVKQNGSGNNSIFNQGWGGTPAFNSSATIEQAGNNHFAIGRQMPISNAEQHVKQSGFQAHSTVYQEHGGPGVTLANVTQASSGNVVSEVYQGTGGSNTVNVVQNGSDIFSDVDQYGGPGKSASVGQGGTNLMSEMLQVGSGGAYGFVRQGGDNNDSFVTQTSDGSLYGAALQNGTGLHSTITQEGGMAGQVLAYVIQDGDNHHSTVTQMGSTQQAWVTQGGPGAGHVSNVTQTSAAGNTTLNIATVTQN